jgi:hypothetical protein
MHRAVLGVLLAVAAVASVHAESNHVKELSQRVNSLESQISELRSMALQLADAKRALSAAGGEGRRLSGGSATIPTLSFQVICAVAVPVSGFPVSTDSFGLCGRWDKLLRPRLWAVVVCVRPAFMQFWVRLIVQNPNARIKFASGANLYETSANVLKTDASLNVNGNVVVQGSVTASGRNLV